MVRARKLRPSFRAGLLLASVGLQVPWTNPELPSSPSFLHRAHVKAVLWAIRDGIFGAILGPSG